jgi:hypothetical protein
MSENLVPFRLEHSRGITFEPVHMVEQYKSRERSAKIPQKVQKDVRESFHAIHQTCLEPLETLGA